MATCVYDLMFVTPTPTNTPHMTASATSSPAEYVVVDVASANHAAQGMPALTLAPSVQKALRKKLNGSGQRNTTPATFDVGNVAKPASAMEALHL